MIEFILIMPILFALVFVQLDVAFAIYAQATLLQAVRQGVRYGVTNQTCGTGTTVSGCVQQTVVTAANGLLSGAFGNTSSKISVTCYYYDATAGDLAVATTNQNAGGNVMGVQGNAYNLPLMLPIIFFGNGGSVSKAPVTFSVAAADRIEPITQPPAF